jgi:hypothetical protein
MSTGSGDEQAESEPTAKTAITAAARNLKNLDIFVFLSYTP